ncbi:HK97 gp10 family phage protein [Blastococcus sp. TF02A-26]|uniref:HK97 gp10 family phage protein n=1 Tax=Blastococcus sp. TF02A-26 TaxID=2250577 RepID=UPI000DE8B9F9|nr:HK97 gp10 family phage protein [Blastococcus sp. TF02A-26]RBY82679.1 HK97 gp10 family phage protein [Blastococcus sp. TF02A-26]
MATDRLGSVTVDQLAKDLLRMSAATRGALRRRIEALGQPLLADAKSRASWSTRIPAAMSVRPIASVAAGRVGLQLRVSSADAPHARAYEGISDAGSRGGSFRHPVYGNRDVWVSQAERPYAWPAVVAMGDKARQQIAEAAEDAAREAGFR